MFGMMNTGEHTGWETKASTRVFFNGAPGNGYINFGKVVDGMQALYTEDGEMHIPANCPTHSMEAVAAYCGFDFRGRHPETLEILDYE